ncbi:MAG: MlaD family protein [Verrucomicrobiales bacterium]|nr:MlaD family protein [Verrucomicrobiales bacterium]
MSLSSHRTEIQVGLFVLLGAALVAGLVLRFSRPQIGSAGGYAITVEVKDATGIREGVPVRLGGVDVGRVAADPVLNEDFVLLSVPLEIFPGNRIPVGSTVKVGTSGLMGDSYVRIVPPERRTGEFLPEGHRLVADPPNSLTDLAGEAGEALVGVTDASVEMRSAADQVERLALRIEKELLSDENLENLRVLLSEMRATSETLHTASARLPQLLDESSAAINGVTEASAAAKTSLTGLDESVSKFGNTLKSVDPVFQEFDGILDELRKTIATTDRLLNEIEKGEGLSAALLKDPGMKRDFAEVLDKLNRYGFLFYPREGGAQREGSIFPEEGDDADRKVFPGLRRQP